MYLNLTLTLLLDDGRIHFYMDNKLLKYIYQKPFDFDNADKVANFSITEYILFYFIFILFRYK